MPRFEPDFLSNYHEVEIVSELRRVASLLKKTTLSRKDIDTHGRMSSATVIKKFGSLRKALQAAGLKPTRFMKSTDDELLAMVVELWTLTLERYGRSPFRNELRLFGFPVSGDTYLRRFGSWNAALLRAAKTVNDEGASEEADKVPSEPAQSTPEPTLAGAPKRRSLSIRKRFFVFKRDKYRCRMCGATGVEIEVDHIVPVHQGGSDALDNLQTMCLRCNRGKRASSQ